jgi:hypothetical protein
MTQESKTIFKSGWGIFVAASAVISLAIDLWQPSYSGSDGNSYPLFGGGSATLGWLMIVVLMVLPAFGLREFRKSHVPKFVAIIWCLIVWFVWAGVHAMSAQASHTQPRGSLLFVGGLVLCWRFLRYGADQQTTKTFYFRRGPTGRIEGPGPLLHIRAHLMKHGGLTGVEYAENKGVPPETIPSSDWRPLLQR